MKLGELFTAKTFREYPKFMLIEKDKEEDGLCTYTMLDVLESMMDGYEPGHKEQEGFEIKFWADVINTISDKTGEYGRRTEIYNAVKSILDFTESEVDNLKVIFSTDEGMKGSFKGDFQVLRKEFNRLSKVSENHSKELSDPSNIADDAEKHVGFVKKLIPDNYRRERDDYISGLRMAARSQESSASNINTYLKLAKLCKETAEDMGISMRVGREF